MSLVGSVFVGDDRHQLVDDLLARFDAVATGSEPHLVCLVGRQGCGKTRVVQEFYARLSANRQDQPPYWPPRIVADTAGSMLKSRKRVYPQNQVVPVGAIMRWLWWGVRADEDASGSPLRALANGAAQLQVHIGGLIIAINQRKQNRELAADSLGALIGLVPGLGLVELGLSAREVLPKVWKRVSAAWERRKEADRERQTGGRHIQPERFGTDQLVDDHVRAFEGVLGRALPMVLFIDDAHWADPATVSLLDRMVRSASPVLILCTAWPETMKRDQRDEATLPVVQRVRFGSWLEQVERSLPARVHLCFLDRLSDLDIERMLFAIAPRTSGEVIKALVELADGNPLVLRGVLELSKLRNSIVDAAITLDPAELGEMPRSLKRLWQAQWDGLPGPVQHVLSHASLQGPSFASEIVRVTAADLLGLVAGDPVTEAVDPHGWARVVERFVQEFTERALFEVASEAQQDVLSYGDRKRARGEIVLAIAAIRNGIHWDGLSSHARRVLLSVRLRLAEEGFLADASDAAASAMELAAEAAGSYDWATAVRSAELGVGWRRESLSEIHSVSDLTLLAYTDALANYRFQAGDSLAALELFKQVLADRERILGTHHPDTLSARSNLAWSYGSAGRTNEALALQEEVLADRERILGPDHPDTLSARSNLAASYGSAGRTNKALALQEEVLADRERILGPDHPDTLSSRNNLAWSYGSAGRTNEAIALQEEVLADRERILGPDHPDTLSSRNNLAEIRQLLLEITHGFCVLMLRPTIAHRATRSLTENEPRGRKRC